VARPTTETDTPRCLLLRGTARLGFAVALDRRISCRAFYEVASPFPHELRARIDVCTFDWGGFTLADDNTRERLRQEIANHEYDLVFGDPLDSLGIEGVGSPEDTRKFWR
jgi:hypothetical protein